MKPKGVTLLPCSGAKGKVGEGLGGVLPDNGVAPGLLALLYPGDGSSGQGDKLWLRQHGDALASEGG